MRARLTAVLAVQLQQLLVVRAAGVLLLQKVAHEELAVLVADLGAPALGLLVPEDAPGEGGRDGGGLGGAV
jgi:hypothetical protein